MRIDVLVFERGLASSRTEAKSLVLDGCVSVDGKKITKPSFDVADGAALAVDGSTKKYVSRGGFKLEAALAAFDASPAGKRCIDIGASSGGFTDCLLKNGAGHVVCVDSGRAQLVGALRADDRVTSLEGFNARYMTAKDFDGLFDFAVMDVSFISATYIIPAVHGILISGGDFVCLVKPQFEVGRSGIGKGGIVKDESLRRAALQKVILFAESVGFCALGSIESPIKGGDGNTEYLVHFKKR